MDGEDTSDFCLRNEATVQAIPSFTKLMFFKEPELAWISFSPGQHDDHEE